MIVIYIFVGVFLLALFFDFVAWIVRKVLKLLFAPFAAAWCKLRRKKSFPSPPLGRG